MLIEEHEFVINVILTNVILIIFAIFIIASMINILYALSKKIFFSLNKKRKPESFNSRKMNNRFLYFFKKNKKENIDPSDRRNKRKIVCLVGSTKFKDAFEKANREESAKGNIILTVAMFGHIDGLDMSGEEKKMFDVVHLSKIELADEILVLNVNNYIGESTSKEIAYAKSLNKPIRYLVKREGE